MSAEMNDRAAGAMLGMACGDALGAGYEFGPPLPDDAAVEMKGGGTFRWAPGEWTDDTSMAIPLLEVAARGGRFEGEALDEVAAAWLDWGRTAPDVGNQTRAVFRAARQAGTAAALTEAALAYTRSNERSAGNGSLMRTAPVALAYLDDEAGLVAAARQVSDLTHADPLAGDACVLWCLTIRRAVLTGELDLRAGLSSIDERRQAGWAARIDEAERKQPRDFPSNGWAGGALQAAWSAIVHGSGLVDVLERAVRGGNDTDTVAAIAGGLAGAVHGASAIPARWRRILHGWPGLRADDLVRKAVLAANRGRSDGKGWPSADRFPSAGQRTLVQHPHDEGVWLGSLKALDDLPDQIDAVVSLCRVGTKQTDRERIEFWLVDQDGRNPNLDLVLRDAADTVAALRAEGRTVLVHCFEGRSRTPSVGAAYSVLHLDRDADVALREVTAALPEGAPAPFLQKAVRHLRSQKPAAEPTAPRGASTAGHKPVLYVDLDNTLVDFRSGIERLPSKARAEYGPSAEEPDGHYDNAPGIFALMEPMPGAVEAFRELAKVYDAYILSTAPWDDPSAWAHKLEWVQLHFGRGEEEDGERNPAYKRLILSHHKDLNRGDYLIDDRTANGAGRFDGELLLFGSDEYPDWAAVTARLLRG